MLTSAEKKALRGHAQRLKPRIKIGKQGLTPPVIEEIKEALTREHLIKIRLEGDRQAITSLLLEIEEKTPGQQIGRIGKTAAFYQAPSEKEKDT